MGFLLILLIFKDLFFPVNFDFNKAIALKSVFAFAIPLTLLAITFLIGKQVGLDVKLTENLSSLIPIMIVGIIIGAIGEEIGWRSFLQPTLEKKNQALAASMIVGVIWGLWHIGHYKNGPLFMLGFLLFTISASIILAWILRDTKFNLIISVLFHVSVNLGFLVLFKNSVTDAKLMLLNGIVWAISAIAIVLLTGKDLIKS